MPKLLVDVSSTSANSQTHRHNCAARGLVAPSPGLAVAQAQLYSRVMDHRTFLAGLDAQTRAELTARSDAPGLCHIGLHWGLIGALGAAIAIGVSGWWLLLLPQGILIVFLFTALHETVHQTAFASPGLNRWVARVNGLLLVLPSEAFRTFHFAHHRHTHDPQRDPELATPKPEKWVAYIWMLTGLPLWHSHVVGLARLALGRELPDYVPARGRDKVVREARAFVIVYVGLLVGSLAIGSTVLVWVWIVPALLGQPFLRAYLLAEHARCPHVANVFENTRTTFTNRLVRWLAWNCRSMPSITPTPPCRFTSCLCSPTSSVPSCA